MKIKSFRINGRSVSRLSINGKAVSLGQEPVLCDALCFTAKQAGSTVKLTKAGSAPVVNLQTSTDGSSWTPYAVNDIITLTNVDDKVYFKAVGSNERIATSTDNYNNFVMTGKITTSGNVNSLLEEDEETARTISLAGKDYCYYKMFNGCTSLTTAPALPATTLANYCYGSMFNNCTALTTAPELPATTLANNCYNNMFNGCTSLTTAPELPATTLANYCYNGMFYGCTSLTTAPDLPATTLASSCYSWMFSDCTSLTTAPELPATTLAGYCYSRMFNGCTSLTTAPELPATTLTSYCYFWMFSDCTSLSSLKVAFTAWGSQTANWLNNVAATGTFRCPQALIDNTTERTTSTVPESWNMVAYDSIPDCLCFTALEAGSTVKLTKVKSAPDINLQTSTNRSSWTPYVVEDVITLANVNDKVYFKAVGSNSVMGSSLSNYNKFVMTGKIAASGNVNSLLEEDEETARTISLAGKDYCYNGMFNGCTALTTAPELPATTLANSCYSIMFWRCTSLTQAPALPATTLTERCYNLMFLECKSLTQAPALPATTLANNCYNLMFNGCTSLSSLKVAFTAWGSQTANWLNNVAATGTFECPQTLIDNTTTRDGSTVPESWTMTAYDSIPDCLCFTALKAGSTVKLTKNGDAPAVNLQTSTDGSSWTPYTVNDVITLTNVGDKVYFKAVGSNSVMGSSLSNYNKFVMTGKIAASGNINSLLEEDEETARTISLAEKNFCYYNMFSDCYSLTSTPVLPATTLAERCYDSMFRKCSSLTTAPALPATTLAERCYDSMFSQCTSLTTAPELPATTLANLCYGSMFSYCTSLTTAPELPATTLANLCYLSMFSDCSKLTQAPALPATTLAGYCYYSMFSDCTSLSSLKVAFTAWGSNLANNTAAWLINVAATGTFRCPQTLIDNTTERGSSTVPESWTMVAV